MNDERDIGKMLDRIETLVYIVLVFVVVLYISHLSSGDGCEDCGKSKPWQPQPLPPTDARGVTLPARPDFKEGVSDGMDSR